MSIKDSYNKERVTFDMQDGVEEKIDTLTVMMSKLAANNEGTNEQFKPKIFKSKRRGQSRNFHDKCNYDQRNYQNRYRSNSGDRRIQYGQITDVGQGMNKAIGTTLEEETFRGNVRTCQNQNFRRQNNRGGYRGNYRNENYER